MNRFLARIPFRFDRISIRQILDEKCGLEINVRIWSDCLGLALQCSVKTLLFIGRSKHANGEHKKWSVEKIGYK